MKKLVNIYTNMTLPLKASFWFTVSSFLQKGIALLTTPIFTRLLGSEEYGVVNIYYSWYDILLAITFLNLSKGVYNNGLINYEDDKPAFTSSLQGLSTVITASVFVIYILFHDFWNNVLGLPTVLVLALFVQLFTAPAMELWLVQQRFEYKYSKIVLVNLSIAILAPILAVLLLKTTSAKIEARILSFVFIQVSFYIVIYIHNAFKGKKFYEKKYWKYALKFNVPLVPHFLSLIVLNNSDRIMIGAISGVDKAGLYSVAYSAAMLLNLLNTSISSSLLPWTYKKMSLKKFEDIRIKTIPIIIFVGIMNLALIAFAPEVMKFFAPKEYYEAIWVIPPVTISVFLMFVYSLFINIEMFFEETKFLTVASVFGALINIVLNIIFIPIYGYIAAGYTTLLCYILFTFSHYFFMKIILKKNNIINLYNAKFLLIFSILFIVVAFLLMFIYDYNLIRYFLIFITLLIISFKGKKIAIAIKNIKND